MRKEPDDKKVTERRESYMRHESPVLMSPEDIEKANLARESAAAWLREKGIIR